MGDVPACYVSLTDGISGQIITTSAEVTLNGGLIRELPQNPLNSGGIRPKLSSSVPVVPGVWARVGP